MDPADLTQPTEQRRWPRLREELLGACRAESRRDEMIYFTRNLSARGLMFDSPESISPGTRLEMEWYAPVDCEKQTRLYMCIGAQVQWTRKIPDAVRYEGSNRYRVGVAFDQIDPRDHACLDEYVKKRLLVADTEAHHVD